jgi:Mce-associated membrane protein
LAEAKEPARDAATSKADTMALIAEAEAEAAEAEALAAAARARARAARLRREALAQEEKEALEAEAAEAAEAAEEDATEAEEQEEEVSDTVEATDANEAETEEEEEEEEEVSDSADEAETEEAKEEASVETDETAEEAEPEAKPARSWRRLPSLSVTWKAAVILLICAFVGASGWMMWQRHEISEHNQRVANFLAGARQGVVNMTSLDFNRAKEDVQRVIDSSTGQFRDDFQQRAKDFMTVVEQSKVVTQGTVNAAAVQSVDGNSALVLVAATSRITNAAGAKDEPRNWRLKVTVTEDGGQYKMSKVEFVP